MATLLVDRSGIELRADGAALAVYEEGERRGTVPMKLLERVVLQGTIRLDTGVLTRLAEAGVPTLVLGGRTSRRVALLVGPGYRDASVRLAQFQCALDAAWCDAWSRRLVLGKLRAQLRLLRRALEERPDARKPLFDAIASLEEMYRTLKSNERLAAASVRGIEGASAAAYFRGFGALFPEGLGFRGRNRRPPKDPVNAALSLAYTLLHFDAVRATLAAGLDPMIGFYHRPAHGRESLACDFIEPLRPHADAWVRALFRQRTLRAESFAMDKGACLLGKAGRAAFYEGWERFAPLLRRALRRQCAALARALRQRGEPLVEKGEESGDEP
ncbi:MAG: CRISPR-associated endonuclease Cas1 [Burkholderiales bacterium]|nr:CRISPR-associated endonuclease Cas1 [Burkholderiales bacterium]